MILKGHNQSDICNNKKWLWICKKPVVAFQNATDLLMTFLWYVKNVLKPDAEFQHGQYHPPQKKNKFKNFKYQKLIDSPLATIKLPHN